MSPRPSPRGDPHGFPRRGVLAVVVVSAFALRLGGLLWGLPDATHCFSYHPDEFDVAGRAIRILNTGDWNPEFFNYGSLSLYLTAVVAAPFHALGLVKTVTGTHIVARLLSALFGAATVLVAARIARRRVGPSLALFAALAVAAAPGHVEQSGFGTVDAAATFLAALALLFALSALEGGRRDFLLAGAAAGLAAGTKYTAGLALVAPCVAALLAADRPAWTERLARAGLAAGAAVVAFLVAVPFALVTPGRFLADVYYELVVHPREGHLDLFTATGNGWTYHLLENFPYVFGWPLLLLALAGLVVMAARHRPADLVLLSFALPYWAGLGFSHVRFLRYALPLVPVFAVAAAVALAALQRRMPRHRAPPLALGATALVYAAALTGVQIDALLRPDPRTRAAGWIFANAPEGATVGMASAPWFFTPPITPWNGGERSVPRFNATPAPYRFVVCSDWNTTLLASERPYLFMMSEFEWREAERLRSPAGMAFLEMLRRDYVPAAHFVGIPAGTRRWFGRAFAPHDWLYPFAEVRVWRRRD